MAWPKVLTEFGDIALLVPLAAVMLLWLLLTHSLRDAAWWAIAVVFCTVLTAVLKVSFYGCPPSPNLRAALAVTRASVLSFMERSALVTATQTRGLQRIIAIGVGASFILAIAASRALPAHNASEVGLGLTIGMAALILFCQSYWRYREAKIWLSPLFAPGGALVAVLYGRELDAEHFLHEIAEFRRIRCV
jgi:hypothetical protein